MKNKIMINASNLYVGGGVQVAVSVIEELSQLNIPFVAAISPLVEKQLSTKALKQCVLIGKSPSGLRNFEIRKKLSDIVYEYSVSNVFTVFGPSYWTPPKHVKHTVGFALPWLIYDVDYLYSKLTLLGKLKKYLLKYLQVFYYKNNANYIITETDDVSENVCKLMGFSKDKVFTVSNTLNSIFYHNELYDDSVLNRLPPKKDDEYWLLTISHNYPHKNLGVIKELVRLLPNKYKFITTLNEDFTENLAPEHKERIITLGAISVNQCPPLYGICDALFLPTLLECFSASYLEAMYSEVAILTSDLSFAHTVCKEAALYFNPYDINDMANKIKESCEDAKLKSILIKNGREQLIKFPDARDRAMRYMDIISS